MKYDMEMEKRCSWPNHKIELISKVAEKYKSEYFFEDFKKKIGFSDLFNLVLYTNPGFETINCINVVYDQYDGTRRKEGVTNPWLLYLFSELVNESVNRDIGEICSFFELDLVPELEKARLQVMEEGFPDAFEYGTTVWESFSTGEEEEEMDFSYTNTKSIPIYERFNTEFCSMFHS